MDTLLQGLRAIAEPTRLRLVALCAQAELTVSELVHILGQSQPCVSRHLRLLTEAGVLERHREGAWARYRLVQLSAFQKDVPGQITAQLSTAILNLLPEKDPTLARDQERLTQVRQDRAVAAADYFARNAADWNHLRTLHVDEAEVNAALQGAFAGRPIRRFLDIGTGTGRVLSLLGDQAEEAVGVDLSVEMLSIARAAVEQETHSNIQVRRADMRQLPWEDGAFDAACLHMVLHYAERPELALREAGRVLCSGGRLVVVDFASHGVEELRTRYAHLWPGFSEEQMLEWLTQAGFRPAPVRRLEGGPLTVCVWVGERQ